MSDNTMKPGSGEITAPDSGLLADPHHQGMDAKLLKRALRERWPIPEKIRPRIVERLVDIVDQSPDDGDAIKAASVLRSMDSDNLAAVIEANKNERLDTGKPTQAIQMYGKDAPVEAV